MPYDMTDGFQLMGLPRMKRCLDVTSPYPFADINGDIYPIFKPKYDTAAAFPDQSVFDWEPYTASRYSTGTISITNGVGTITGGSLPSGFNVGDNDLYPNRLYINGTYYPVQTYTPGGTLTLKNLSVTGIAGASYVFAAWDYRRADPSFCLTDVHQAHDEMANAMTQVMPTALANGARFGVYSLVMPLFARKSDIISNTNYPTWQADVATMVNYVTSSGRTLVDIIKSTGGIVVWPNYCDADDLDTAAHRYEWRLRNQRVMQTLNSHGIPNAPLFLRYTLTGYGEFNSTGTGTEVPDEFQMEQLQDVHQEQPYMWGWWGTTHVTHGPMYAGYEDKIATFQQTLRSSRIAAPSLISLLGP